MIIILRGCGDNEVTYAKYLAHGRCSKMLLYFLFPYVCPVNHSSFRLTQQTSYLPALTTLLLSWKWKGWTTFGILFPGGFWNAEDCAPSKRHRSNCLQTAKIPSEAGVADYLDLQSTWAPESVKEDFLFSFVWSNHKFCKVNWLIKKKLCLYHWPPNLVTFHLLIFPINLSFGLVFHLLFVWLGNLLCLQNLTSQHSHQLRLLHWLPFQRLLSSISDLQSYAHCSA